jgi:signal transduction histidine kinase
LFDAFYRVDPARQADHHLGLGLYLVRTHIERLGGRYSVRSEVGKGTTFELEVPGLLARSNAPSTTDDGAPTFREASNANVVSVIAGDLRR